MNNEVDILIEKIKKAELDLKSDKLKLQEICPHKHITKRNGYMEYQGYDRDYIEGWIKCDDCGLSAYERDKGNTYNLLYQQLLKNHHKL